jgi:hypothetical protein
MGRTVAIALGVLMVLVGLLWTLQGLGYVGGSSMSGNDTWAIIGPAFAGLGVALVWVVATGRRS